MSIYIRSKFNGWRESTAEKALDYAKWKFKAIYPGQAKEEWLLEIINNNLRGISFTLNDLKR